MTKENEALTPRHEAPAETLGYLFEDDDGTEWSEADPRVSGENEYATNVRPVTLAMAVAEMRSAWELLSEQREALIQADLKIRSLPGTDQSDVEGLRAVIDAKHEAPAEGAGELKNLHRLASQEADHLEREAEEADDNNWQDWAVTMRQGADYIRQLIRARSSAPEAREEALGNLLAVIHGDGGHRALEVGVEQAAAEAEKIVANLLSSAPEAREGGAVERIADGLAHLVAAISLLNRAEEIGKKPSMATGSKKMFDQMLRDYEGAANRMRKAIYTRPAAPSADKLREDGK